MYDRGEGVPMDVGKASQLFEASARQGYRGAQFSIAVQYELGRGVTRDRKRAIYCFDQASRNGDEDAPAYVRVLSQPGVPRFQSRDALAGYVRGAYRPPAPTQSVESCPQPTSKFQCQNLSPRCSVAWMATCAGLR